MIILLKICKVGAVFPRFTYEESEAQVGLLTLASD